MDTKIIELEGGSVTATRTYSDVDCIVCLKSSDGETKEFTFDREQDSSFRRGDKFFEQLSQDNILGHLAATAAIIS